MYRKDRFHQAVKNSLEKDGWTITHDPLSIKIGTLRL
jgi:XisH protein